MLGQIFTDLMKEWTSPVLILLIFFLSLSFILPGAERPLQHIQKKNFRNRIDCIVFDGSSHARAFLLRVCTEKVGGYRSTLHPSQPAVEINFIGDNRSHIQAVQK